MHLLVEHLLVVDVSGADCTAAAVVGGVVVVGDSDQSVSAAAVAAVVAERTEYTEMLPPADYKTAAAVADATAAVVNVGS